MILTNLTKLKSSPIEKNELKKDKKKVPGGTTYVSFKTLRLDNSHIT